MVTAPSYGADTELPVVVPGSGVISSLAVARNQTLTFSFRITDDVGCCSQITFDLYGSPGRNVNTGNALPSLAYVTNPNETRISGTAVDGRYETMLTIPANFSYGTYYLKVQAIDLAGGYTHLEQIGSIEVGEDTELPILDPTSGEISKSSLSPGDSLTVRFKVTDAYGCCRWAGIGIYSDSGQNVNTRELIWRRDQPVTRVSGTESDGVYSYTIQIPSDASPGTYFVKAQANDHATWYTHLEQLGSIIVLGQATSANAGTQAIPPTNASAKINMKLKQHISGKSLATQLGMDVKPKSKIKLSVAKVSKRVCKVSSGKLVAQKPGNCSVTVSVTPAKSKKVKKPKAVIQSTVISIY